ncbi:MAG: hypothetical protein ACPG5T_02025 [Endozoicomonas sp.]
MFGHTGVGSDMPVEFLSQCCDLAEKAKESISWFGHEVKVVMDLSVKYLLKDMQKHCPEEFKVFQDCVITAANQLSDLNLPEPERASQFESDSGVGKSSLRSSGSQQSLPDLTDNETDSGVDVSSTKSTIQNESLDSLIDDQAPVLTEVNSPTICSSPVKHKQSRMDEFLARQDALKQKQNRHKANYITRSEAQRQWEKGFRKTPTSTVKQGALTKKQSERAEQFQSRQNAMQKNKGGHNANYTTQAEAERQWKKGLRDNAPTQIKQGKLAKKQREFVQQLSEKTGQKPTNEFLSHHDHYNRWKNSLGGNRAKSK